jgi:DNA repair protein RadC
MIILQDKKQIVASPETIVVMLRTWFKTLDEADNKKEHFVIIHLNVRNRIQCIEVVSIGILNAAIIHPRETFKRAVMQSSAHIIVAHNHPSNDCEPSDEDIVMTEKLKKAGDILGIPLIDHIIFGETEYLSFIDKGIL